MDERVRPLVFWVKAWAKGHELNSPPDGSLSSYSWVILVLHYLMLPRSGAASSIGDGEATAAPVLPCLQDGDLLSKWRKAGAFCDRGFELTGGKPSVEGEPHKIDGYECEFVRCGEWAMSTHREAYGANTATPAQLLLGFFHYYAREFSVESQVACISRAEGKVKSKNIFKKPARWRLAVEDPFEKGDHDLGVVFNQHMLQKTMRLFRKECDTFFCQK